LATVLDAFVQGLDYAYDAPLALRSAIDRCHDWSQANPQAGAPAREQVVQELLVVYGLDRYPEVARYHLCRSTYFAQAEPAGMTARWRGRARSGSAEQYHVEQGLFQAVTTQAGALALQSKLEARPCPSVSTSSFSRSWPRWT
jgi:hypothetical protein